MVLILPPKDLSLLGTLFIRSRVEARGGRLPTGWFGQGLADHPQRSFTTSVGPTGKRRKREYVATPRISTCSSA